MIISKTSLRFGGYVNPHDYACVFPSLNGCVNPQEYASVYYNISSIRNAAPPPITLKVIIETSPLTRREIIAAYKLAEAAKADVIQGEGATFADVGLMAALTRTGSRLMEVKVSGGIETLDECVGMMRAGAERIGTGNGVAIMEEARERARRRRSAGAEEEEGRRLDRMPVFC